MYVSKIILQNLKKIKEKKWNAAKVILVVVVVGFVK